MGKNILLIDKSNPTITVSSLRLQMIHPKLSQVLHVLGLSHEHTGEVVQDGVLQVPGQVGGQNLGEYQ